MAVGPVLRNHAAERSDHLRGRLDFGIAQGEVENVLRTALLAELDADFEHPSDPGGALYLFGDSS
jgi:hypothetical protein